MLLPEPMPIHCKLDPDEQIAMKFLSKYILFQENACEIVVFIMSNILVRCLFINMD